MVCTAKSQVHIHVQYALCRPTFGPTLKEIKVHKYNMHL